MADAKRRKAPRRQYHGQAGILYRGHMTITRCNQLGEGGALIRSDELLDSVAEGEEVVVTLFLPNIGGLVATAQCVYRSNNTKIGLQFCSLEMKYKKKIREFVSRRKQVEEAV
jgi:hypothetical protein